MSVPDGDLFLARDYLDRVAGSNSEDVAQAADLLKRVKVLIQERAQAEVDAQVKAKMEAKTKAKAEPSGTTPATEGAMVTQ